MRVSQNALQCVSALGKLCIRERSTSPAPNSICHDLTGTVQGCAVLERVATSSLHLVLQRYAASSRPT